MWRRIGDRAAEQPAAASPRPPQMPGGVDHWLSPTAVHWLGARHETASKAVPKGYPPFFTLGGGTLFGVFSTTHDVPSHASTTVFPRMNPWRPTAVHASAEVQETLSSSTGYHPDPGWPLGLHRPSTRCRPTFQQASHLYHRYNQQQRTQSTSCTRRLSVGPRGLRSEPPTTRNHPSSRSGQPAGHRIRVVPDGRAVCRRRHTKHCSAEPWLLPGEVRRVDLTTRYRPTSLPGAKSPPAEP